MKKVLSAILCLVMLASACLAFAGCEKYDEDYTGPEIPVFFSEIPTTFDPHLAYLDNTASSVLSLMYEGLYKYNSKGKVVKGVATGYKWVEKNDKEGSYVIEINLRETRWNDQITVKADDFVYAWRRLVDPATNSSAACMLYMIKNAYEIRNAVGEITKYDLGAEAVDTNTLRITFAEKPNMDLFMEYLASPALVPLRDTAINKIGNNDWASTSAIVVANGPFYLKNLTVEQGGSGAMVMTLERNRYYKRCIEKDKEDLVNEYVLPYRLVCGFGADAKAKIENAGKYGYEQYQAGEVLMNALLPLSARKDADGVKLIDTMSTHTYVFNTKNPLFEKAEVRRALSLAIDRTKLAEEIVYYAKPAEGIIPDGVYETTNKNKTQFRDVGKSLIEATANIKEANSLLTKAGIDKSTAFTITVKATDEVALATAKYCCDVWNKQLKLNCSVRVLGYYVYDDVNECSETDPRYDPLASEYDNLVFDLYTACYLAGGDDVTLDERKLKLIPELDVTKNEKAAELLAGFDIIAIDSMQLSVDAFATLASYATYFNGGAIDLQALSASGESKNDNAPIAADHISGYASDSYNQLIQKAYKEKDLKKRADLLHQAEALLMKDMPIMPLFVYQNGYLTNKSLKNVKYTWGGGVDFAKVEGGIVRTQAEE